MDKEKILKTFSINEKQRCDLEKYLKLLSEYNSHTNIVGKSTLEDPWKSHILDSLQLLYFIEKKSLSILDMGTGAGLPGCVLNIAGCLNVTLVDSNQKKINFLKLVKKEIMLTTNIALSRLENINDQKFDIITSRALANLTKLLSYSQKFLKKNTVLMLLKGKTVNEEIVSAKKNWKFSFVKHKSISDERGSILIIKNIKKI